MPLQENEIQPGTVAYFDIEVLHQDRRVQVTGDPVRREATGNQFVCYKVTEGVSYWSPLTGTYRYPRLRIEPEWVSNGYGPLATGEVWLQDGKNTYRGPHASFIAATATELPFDIARPHLSNAAIAAIHAQICNRGGAN